MSEPQYDGQDMNDYYEFQELRECRRTLQQLRERIEQLPTIQHGSPNPTHFEATPLIRRDDVLALLNSQQDKS